MRSSTGATRKAGSSVRRARWKVPSSTTPAYYHEDHRPPTQAGLSAAGGNLEAGPRGFEPPVSSVTGWHVRPLHHGPGSVNHSAVSRTAAWGFAASGSLIRPTLPV